MPDFAASDTSEVLIIATGGVADTGGSTPAPTITSFTASPTTIKAGNSSTLSWTATGATTLSIDQDVGAVTGTTSKSVTPSMTTTYTLTAQNSGGSVTGETIVIVVPPPSITSFTAAATTVNAGSTTTLTAVFSGSRATIDHSVGNVTSGNGVATGPLFAPTTYTLTVQNTLGESVTATTTVDIIGFVATGSTAVRRLHQGAALLSKGKVLVVGGLEPVGPTAWASAEIYDPSTGVFAATGSMSVGRYGLCSCGCNEFRRTKL